MSWALLIFPAPPPPPPPRVFVPLTGCGHRAAAPASLKRARWLGGGWLRGAQGHQNLASGVDG